MNKYLLLRDNKQQGPFSLEELLAKGLKPYDLVWLEGRSAAWRYPSEFDELKEYAPVVEEQPFDRFYKKPADQVKAQAASTVQAVEKNVTQPVEEKPIETNTAAKHIYVTMPTGKAQTATTPVAKKEEPKKEEKAQPVQQQQSTQQAKKNTPVANNNAKGVYLISEEDDEQNSAMLKGYNNKKQEDDENNSEFLSDYEARKAAYQTKKSSPVKVKEEPVQQKAAPVEEEKKKEKPLAAYQSKKRELKDLFAIPSHFSGSFFQDNKVLVRSLVAAVLILGGVVIGLIINSGKHQPDTQVLETLVKEIREQQKDKSPSTPPETSPNTKHSEQPDEAATNDNLNNYTEQSPANNNAIASDPATRHAINKKETNTQATKPISVPVSNTNPEVVEPQPAVNDNGKDKINQEIIEKARKNIYDLVGVEASQFKVGLLGGISDLDITISNNSLYALDQVAVEIKYFGPEKKLVKTQTLMFNHVPAGKQRTLEAPSTRRGISIDYSITGINSKALGLAQANN